MATDPTTGQTILTPRFDQAYAGFLDPTQFGQIAAGQSQAGLLGSLGQQLLQAGYVPNSGSKGAISQMIQALAGGLMLKRSQDQIAGLSQQQAEAMNAAQQAKHIQDQKDLDAAANRAIYQKTGEKKGELQAGIDLAPQTTAAEVAKQTALNPVEAAKAGLVAEATLPSQQALEKTKGAYQVAAATAGAATANQRLQTKENPDGSFTVIQPNANGSFSTTNVALPQGARTKQDVTAIDKRVPVLSDQVNKIDTALQLAQDMKTKMSAGGYDAGSARNAMAGNVPLVGPYLQSAPGQELGTDAGNLILAAQTALQGSGNRGSVAQLRVLQTSKPNAQLSAQANQNAIDKIVNELQMARNMPASELEHYGNGGTPQTWAQASAALAAKNKTPPPSDHPEDIQGLIQKYGGTP